MLVSIISSLGFVGYGVGRVVVGMESLVINLSLGNGIGNLFFVEVEYFGDNGSVGNFDEDNVVKIDFVVRVKESEVVLDFVGFDYSFKNIFDSEDFIISEVIVSFVGMVDLISDSEDGIKVIRGVILFSCQLVVVEVELVDYGVDVEGGIDGIELEGSIRDFGFVGDNGVGDDRVEEFGVFFEFQIFEIVVEGVYEDLLCCVEL